MQKSPAARKKWTAGRGSELGSLDMKHFAEKEPDKFGTADHDYLHSKYLPFARGMKRRQRRRRQKPSQTRMADMRKNNSPLGQKQEIIRPIPNAMTQGALQHRLPLILTTASSFSAPILLSAAHFGDRER